MNIEEEIKKRAQIITQETSEMFAPNKDGGVLYGAANHLINAGGKRLRPVMLMLAAESVGGNVEDVLPAAISVELIHNFTLIHDDIMDEDELRRGLKTVHSVWGVPVGILAGDMLFSKAFENMALCNGEAKDVVECVGNLSRACTYISRGQSMDMQFEKSTYITESWYLDMVADKTASLYATAASIGTCLGGGDIGKTMNLYEYGRGCGVAFQLHDDVLDLTTSEDVLGKNRGSDLKRGKNTLIAIHAVVHGLYPFLDKDVSQEQISRMVEKLIALGSIDYVEELAKSMIEKAKAELDVLEDSDAKEMLLAMADYMVDRKY